MKRLIICSNENCEHSSESNPFAWEDSRTLIEGCIATTPDDSHATSVRVGCPSCRSDTYLYFKGPNGENPLIQEQGYGLY